MLANRHKLTAFGVFVLLVWIARDVQWHATHDTQQQFEDGLTQVEVHWILWVGVIALGVGASWILRAHDPSPSRRAATVSVLAAAVYAAASVWHFAEHAGGADPAAAHIVLYATATALVVAGILSVAGARTASGGTRVGQVAPPPANGSVEP